MRILLTIVHYWDPHGNGRHQSLRPDPTPRQQALQQQLLCLRRLGLQQSFLHMADRAVYPANSDLSSEITLRLVTDGEHHVIDRLPDAFRNCFDHVLTEPADGKLLGFEAQKHLAQGLDGDYDWFGYLEDDLLIHDPCFFTKLRWFENVMGPEAVLLPQRVEFADRPDRVDRFYIDGPIDPAQLKRLVEPGPVRLLDGPGGRVAIEPALNPHAGCFFLSRRQLQYWVDQPHWQDGDVTFISPLESAATLGLAKTFTVFKPCLSTAGWLEVQHYGTSFHSLINEPVS